MRSVGGCGCYRYVWMGVGVIGMCGGCGYYRYVWMGVGIIGKCGWVWVLYL